MGNALERWMGYGSNLAGALVGVGAGGALTGDMTGAAFGAVLGESVTTALGEASHRILSDREKARVGAVVLMARNSLKEAYQEGKLLRGDSFMRSRLDGRAPVEEVIEHVMRAAQAAYEERKLPFIANAMAAIAVSAHVDERTAHWLLTQLETLSWPKLVALSLIGNKDTAPLPDIEVGKPARRWEAWSVHKVIDDLYYSDSLLGYADPDGAKLPEIKRLIGYGLTTPARLVYDGGGLGEVPRSDRDLFVSALREKDADA